MHKVALLPFSVCTIGYLCSNIDAAIAQVTPDNTLNTRVNQNGNVAEITGGETRGSNLFHSFQDFSVPTGNTADFINGTDISNIFSRVTGGNISNIDGLIRANGSANLFLINPAGIIFGENASLNLGGSFFGSTSDSILFPNDIEFSAANPDANPLLTINAPIGFSFRDEPGEITNSSTANSGRGLTVQPGNNISLFGGEINLSGGNITAPGGTIDLASLSTGEISLNDDGVVLAVQGDRNNIFLTDAATLNVRGDNGGAIEINADNLTLTGSSLFLAGIDTGSGFSEAQAGDINITTNNIIARDDSQIRNENLGIGNAGNINITTGSLEFTQGSGIIASTFGRGNAGDVTVNATGNVSFDLNFGGINTNVGLQRNDIVVENSVGDAGNINVNAGSLSLDRGARLVSKTSGMGNAGNISLNVAEAVTVDGIGPIPVTVGDFTFDFTSGIFTQATGDGVGNAGDINISAREFSINNRAIIAADSSTRGNAGNINIDTSENVFFGLDTLFLTQIQPGGVGNGGDIRITTQNLRLVDSFLLSDSRGIGDAGSIVINASESVSLEDAPNTENSFFGEGSLIISGVGILGDETEGNAGNIEINAESLTAEGSSFIVAQTNGTGDGGDIIIQTESDVFLNDSSRIVSQVQENAVGDGGEIRITSPAISLNDVSAISTTTLAGGEGTAGNIILNTQNLTLTDGAIVDALTENEFDGGDITISANTLNLLDGGKIVTATDSTGNAGNISLNVSDRLNISGNNPQFAQFLTELTQDEIIRGNEDRFDADDRFRFATPSSILTVLGDTSGLFANTSENSTGNGGNISIGNAIQFDLTDAALISVGSQGAGSAGSLAISSESLSLNNGTLFAATPSGVGGNITLSIADNLVLENQSLISSQATGNANGGNINIDSQFVIAFPSQNNDIVANAQQGIGGNIDIATEAIFGLSAGNSFLSNTTNDIDASSQFGLDGAISIDATDINPLQGTVELPQSVVEPEQTVAQACQSDRGVGQNSFVIRGKGGIPPAPDAPLSSDRIYSNTVSNNTYPPAIATGKGMIQPARGISVSPDGTISLTAYPTDNSGRRIVRNINCG